MYENNLNGRESSNSIMAFGLGMLAGAVTALLLAPATGEETRRRLGGVAQKVGQKAKDGIEHGREYVTHAKDRVAGAVEEGKAAFRKETTPTSTL